MVLNSTFRRASLDSHLLVTRDRHHTLMRCLSVQTSTETHITVSDTDTTISLVDSAEALVG